VAPAGLAWLLRNSDKTAVSSTLRQIANTGDTLTAADYVDALDATTQLRAAMAEFFKGHDLILTPSAAALPWTADITHPGLIDGQPVGPRGHAVFTAFANAAGLPGASIPCDPSGSGLPIGFQLVGRYGCDDLLFRVAAQFERAYSWGHRWPAIS
jgi:aspartyl-tRNA(Asn)/glutamyl-tRNA(Gln) amidotransferase subunit A